MNIRPHFAERYTWARQRRLFLQLAVWGSLTAYMTYHLFQGNRGLVALWDLKKIVREEKGILEHLTDETASLAKKVKKLRPQSLDIAFLEERAREVLSLALPEEVIVDVSDVVNSGQKNCIISSQPHVRTTLSPMSSSSSVTPKKEPSKGKPVKRKKR